MCCGNREERFVYLLVNQKQNSCVGVLMFEYIKTMKKLQQTRNDVILAPLYILISCDCPSVSKVFTYSAYFLNHQTNFNQTWHKGFLVKRNDENEDSDFSQKSSLDESYFKSKNMLRTKKKFFHNYRLRLFKSTIEQCKDNRIQN